MFITHHSINSLINLKTSNLWGWLRRAIQIPSNYNKTMSIEGNVGVFFFNLILEDAGTWHPFQLFFALCLGHRGQGRGQRLPFWVCQAGGVRWNTGSSSSMLFGDLGSWGQWHYKAIWLLVQGLPLTLGWYSMSQPMLGEFWASSRRWVIWEESGVTTSFLVAPVKIRDFSAHFSEPSANTQRAEGGLKRW